jgi:FkbM family methyltransferase
MESGEANAIRNQDQGTIEIQLDSDLGRYTMQVIEGDFFQDVLASHRPFEEDLLRITTALTKRGDRIIDVGAHMGNHSVYWGLSGRRVIAFEPNPPVNAILRANVERNGLLSVVDVRMAALGRQEGTGTAKQLDRANLGSVTIEAGAGDVPIYPLDSLNLDGLAVLKIDVEGHEADVLAGAVQTLRKWRPYIVAEELEGYEVVEELIGSLGYRRLPLSLAWPPTRIYSPSTRATLRVITVRPYQRLAKRVLMYKLRTAVRPRLSN